jgi:hypothetical protein
MSMTWTGAPRSPKRTWAENDGRSPTIAFNQAGSATDLRVPHISLVFREMWDTTALNRTSGIRSRDTRLVSSEHSEAATVVVAIAHPRYTLHAIRQPSSR